MGKHFIPQAYLRNFEDPSKPGFVWVHDKLNNSAALAEIDHVAQSRNFYDDKIEKLLAAVEGPANSVIKKLISQSQISRKERLQLASYIGVMTKRVPAHRKRAAGMMPEARIAVFSEVREAINELSKDPRADPEIIAKRLTELNAAEIKFAEHPPQEALEQVNNPWPTTEHIELIFSMTWRVLLSNGPLGFISTDNPVFVFDQFGLAHNESEITFPLSTWCALHGSWQKSNSDLVWLKTAPSTLKEFNRRAASVAGRLAFYHGRAGWLLEILRKEKPLLNRINWLDQ
jgi:hypothetical protein